MNPSSTDPDEDRVPSYDDSVPTYEESLQTGAMPPPNNNSKKTPYPESSSQPQSLNHQLSQVRDQRINALIKAYIDPLVQKQVQSGLCKTTLVLVPALRPPPFSSHQIGEVDDGEAVVGFPSTDVIEYVRLQGVEYPLEFWGQASVLEDLEIALKARLQASGHRVAESTKVKDQGPMSPSAESLKSKTSFFRRKSEKSAMSASPSSPSSTSTMASWKFVQEEKVPPGQVRVGVKLQEVSLRAATKWGLFETRTRKAIVVSVEIGN
ncbi:MAG: hypothetical protein MMC33_002353 [Icmadophila ericetorum]|nr:hypothetical protein [Icmadophila ericetorum]